MNDRAARRLVRTLLRRTRHGSLTLVEPGRDKLRRRHPAGPR